MKSKHFHNFWDYFFFKKTVWDVLWKFDRPAKFSSGKCATFCSKSAKTGGKLQKQKKKILFGKIPRTLKTKISTNIKIISAQTSKMIRRKISVTYILSRKVSLDTWKEVLTRLMKKFCHKTKHFLTALKKQYMDL